MTSPCSPATMQTGQARPDGQPGFVAATGASLRGLRHLLNDDLDPGRQYGGLTRFLTAAGDYIWVWPDHAAVYDPGPPTI